MQQAPGPETRAQAADQIVGEPALGRTDGVRVPLGAFEIIDGDEGRLAAHGQTHVLRCKIAVDLLAEIVEPYPGFVRERLCDARRLANALDAHVEGEFDLGKAGAAGDRRGRAVVRRRRDRDVALARQHARGRVEADPARARQVDLGPGVQIGEIVLDLRRPLDRIDVGTDLDQIAGDETGGETEVTEGLDQKPGGVAARAGRGGERLLRRLHARLHADDVADLLLQLRC